MVKRSAFTLLEVLISIALLGIILPALYKSVDLLQDSNAHLFEHVEKSKKISKVMEVFYLDILSSDGNLSIQKDNFTRLCIEQTNNTLYELSSAKVCWVVLKKDRALLRVEGNGYLLPLRADDRVEADIIVYHKQDKVLVLIQQAKKEPVSFMVQGVTKPKKKKTEKKPKKKPKKKKKQPSGKKENNTTKPPEENTPAVPLT